MARYQLKPECVFVDAYDLDRIENPIVPHREKPNTDIKSAHIMDKSTGPPYQYVMLNDGAAFIARFITLGVDSGLIPQILESEYNIKPSQAQKEFNDALTILLPYLDPRTYGRTHVGPASLGTGTHKTGKYDLDFRVNILGGGGWKGPL